MHLFSLGNNAVSCFGLRKKTDSSECVCADGYYEDSSNKDCLPCLRKCKTCINGYQCQSCHDSAGLTQNSPDCTCDVGGAV
jgi:hypothetical protein